MKSNKIFYVIIGLLLAIIVGLLLIVATIGGIAIGATFLGNKPSNVSTVQPTITPVGDQASVPGTDTGADVQVVVPSVNNGNDPVNVIEPNGGMTVSPTTPSKNDGESVFVLDGYEFVVPADYGVVFDDEIGPYIYMNDIFQVRVAPRPESDDKYQSYFNNPSVLEEKAIEQGSVIEKATQSVTVDGIQIFYFIANLDGEKLLVFRTRLDNEASLGGNLVILDYSFTDNDYLNVVASIIKGVSKTDKPNTTKEEFISSKLDVHVGEKVSEGIIDTGKMVVKYGVNDADFHHSSYAELEYDEETGRYRDSYMSDTYDSIYVIVQPYQGGAKAFVEEHYSFTKMEKVEKNGRTFYCFKKSEDLGDGILDLKIIAATDLKDGMIYALDYESVYDHDIDYLYPFFDVEVK